MTPDQIFIALGFPTGLGVCGWLAWQWRASRRDRTVYFDPRLSDAIRRAERRHKRRRQ